MELQPVDSGQLVNNQTARRILAAVQRRIVQAQLATDEQFGEITVEYRRDLRAQLDRLGLARMIAAGPGDLPDIYAEMSPLLRMLAVLLRPRSHVQLALHVLDFLDWYLDRAAPVLFPVRWLNNLLAAFVAVPMIAFAAAAVVTILWRPVISGWEILLLVLIAPLWLAASYWLMRGGQRALNARLQALVFHQYLHDSYLEQPDTSD